MGGIKIRRKGFMADNPAISLPLYTSTKGQTIASQFAARFDGEETLLNGPMNWKTCDPRQIAEWRCPRTQYRA